VVLPRPPFPDAVFHQPGERRQAGNGRIDSLVEKRPLQNDLPFGDVAGQIGNGMGNVVAGHRQDRHLRNGSLAPFQPSGALIDGGQIAVQIAGIAFARRNLAARTGQLPERFAVIGHVGQDDQNVHSLLEGQILGQRQSRARGHQPLDGG